VLRWLAPLFHILEVPSSNLGLETILIFRGFSQPSRHASYRLIDSASFLILVITVISTIRHCIMHAVEKCR
jgi:hypothetical protein